MQIIAGFECAYLPWNHHDLLHTTQHTPETSMLLHYRIAQEHGITMVRDGLSPGHDHAQRFKIARMARMDVIWDLLHYHSLHESAFDYGVKIGRAWKQVNGERPFMCCPQNEPSLAPSMSGKTPEQAAEEGRQILRGVKSVLDTVSTIHVDIPFAPDWFDATVFGVNIYPHTLTAPITDVLKEAQDRTGKYVIVSETSWHDGYHTHDNIKNKGEWLDFVASQCDRVGVEQICWYPFVDCPQWGEPDHPVRWSHGLIHEDLSVDPSLSSCIKRLTHTQN